MIKIHTTLRLIVLSHNFTVTSYDGIFIYFKVFFLHTPDTEVLLGRRVDYFTIFIRKSCSDY